MDSECDVILAHGISVSFLFVETVLKFFFLHGVKQCAVAFLSNFQIMSLT